MRTRWISAAIAALTLSAPAIALAQPAAGRPTPGDRHDDKRDKNDRHDNKRDDGPNEAPPPPKAEQHEAAKAGYVWVDGNYQWKAGKYEWLPGHWERERANKRWQPGKWEKNGDRWAWHDGTWGDAGPTPPAPGNDRPHDAPPPPRAEQHEANKAGYVWVDGDYDWKAGKYEWIPGHWERERANKRWRPGKWEQRDGAWSHTPGDWEDNNTPPPSNDGRPHDAPPPPRAEQHEGVKAGYVWVDGEWDWKTNKYEWIPGHWERERANKRWRPGTWEQRDGAWTHTPGDWDDNTGSPPPPPAPGPIVRDHRRDWKIERPIVANYWPAKGKVGTVIVIHGDNFPKDAIVVWNGAEVRGVKVTDKELRVTVPPDAATGMIAVRAGRGRDIAVGQFEVAASFDPVAEQKRIEEAARKKAEAAWAERQKQLAKDRAAREAAVEQRRAERENNREQRRQEREREIRAKFAAAFLADPNTQDELTLHAQRVADLERMSDVAEIKADGKLAVRIDVLRSREDDRHTQRMATLQASFSAGGAQ